MIIKVNKRENIIQEQIGNALKCDFCNYNDAVGKVTTIFGQKKLCTDCLKLLNVTLSGDDYIFANKITLRGDKITLQDEELKFLDIRTNKELDNLLVH